MKGFVKLHRKILDSTIFGNAEILRLWIYILCSVCFEEQNVIMNNSVVHLKKGQMVTGRKKLSSDLGSTGGKVYNHLKILEKLGLISLESNNKYTVITVINEDFSVPVSNNADNKMTATQQQVNNKRTTNGHIIEYKESKECKEGVEGVKHAHGRFGNVYLSDEEYEALKGEYYEYDELIENLSLKMQSTGKSYSSHYATILKWAKEDGVKPRSEQDFDPEEFFNLAVKASMG